VTAAEFEACSGERDEARGGYPGSRGNDGEHASARTDVLPHRISNVPRRRPDDLARTAGPAGSGVVDGWLVIDTVITAMLRETMPDAEVRVYDMTGTLDHLEVFVRTKAFQGVSPLDRHRMVEKALAPARADGRIHALQIRTATPEDTNG
jgi:stress-induced morphogen